MKPGRELDAKVATHVMERKGVLPEFGCDALGIAIPSYSADIAATWQVVDMMKERFKAKMHLVALDSGCVVRFFNDDISGYGDGETAPLAICLAALKAVGVEVEDA